MDYRARLPMLLLAGILSLGRPAWTQTASSVGMTGQSGMTGVSTPPVAGSSAGSALTSTSPSTKASARRRTRRRKVAVATPAPDATQNQPIITPEQRAADAKLLAQQQARSQAEQQINNQLTQTKMENDRRVAEEVRIQDAPGPAQTGTMVGMPVPAVPQSEQPRIQDAPTATTFAPIQKPAVDDPSIQEAPGPAQTIRTVPASTTTQPPL